MKQIIKNKYLKEFKFRSAEEASTFLHNQNVERSLSIQEMSGENNYCYFCYHSLTKEKQFILSFSSDDDDLNLLFWNDLLVLDAGKNIYLIDENIKIKASFELTTPLIGLYIIDHERLLILEEAFMRVINHTGEIVKSELFDLLEDFNIDKNSLSIVLAPYKLDISSEMVVSQTMASSHFCCGVTKPIERWRRLSL